MLELRARAALHAGRIAEADQTLAAARAAAERIPNLFDARLSRLGELIESARAAQ